MKRIMISLLLAFTAAYSYAATPERLAERVYITTDKGVYVAGDKVWISAWCMDAIGGRSSELSKTAYIELHSPEGMVQTGKIALKDGRGAGSISLLSTLPSGNYSLIAYTATNTQEEGYRYDYLTRHISVVNTLSTERIKDNVEIGEVEESSIAPKSDGIGIYGKDASREADVFPLRITNTGSRRSSIAVSVYHDDGIPAPESTGIDGFADAARRSITAAAEGGKLPDYEGEIIRAHVSGSSQAIMNAAGKSAFLSVPGQLRIYSSKIDENGKVAFYTSNICGDTDVVMEIANLEGGQICHLEVDSPFKGERIGGIPKMTLDPAWEKKLMARSVGMQIENIFNADTLYSYLPTYEHNPFEVPSIIYMLDDYTRFPDMTEVMTEFVQEARVRAISGKKYIQVRVDDVYKETNYRQGLSLVLLDGVPVMDHEKMIQYDPLLVKYLEIFPRTIHLGENTYIGAINFVTYKGNLSGMKFDDNVRIASNICASIPMAYTGENVDSRYPDYRQTIYWHPLITLEPGETIEIRCKTPAYSGSFAVTVEGFDEDFKPVSGSSSFELR